MHSYSYEKLAPWMGAASLRLRTAMKHISFKTLVVLSLLCIASIVLGLPSPQCRTGTIPIIETPSPYRPPTSARHIPITKYGFIDVGANTRERHNTNSHL